MRRLLITALLLFATLALPAMTLADQTKPPRPLLLADSSKKTLALIDTDGNAVWQTQIGPLHDLHLLPNGNVLFQRNWTHIVEVNPRNDEVVWEYHCKPVDGVERIEIHAFQRLDNGNTMIAESGNTRFIEVSPQGEIVKTVPMQVDQRHPHRDTRLARVLKNGHYLAAHEGDGRVREYDGDGEIVWEYDVPLFDKERAGGHGPEAWGNQCFAAVRLDNGNTLISTGNGHAVIEVTPDKEIAWHLTAADLPGVELAWITNVQRLPDGTTVLTNCHAGPNNPQVIAVDKDKNVLWTYKDFDRFGNSLTNCVVVDAAEGTVR